MIKKTFLVKAMHCVSCTMRLQGLEDELQGVSKVDASYRTGKMEVVFNENITNTDEIIRAVGELGYTAELIVS